MLPSVTQKNLAGSTGNLITALTNCTSGSYQLALVLTPWLRLQCWPRIGFSLKIYWLVCIFHILRCSVSMSGKQSCCEKQFSGIKSEEQIFQWQMFQYLGRGEWRTEWKYLRTFCSVIYIHSAQLRIWRGVDGEYFMGWVMSLWAVTQIGTFAWNGISPPHLNPPPPPFHICAILVTSWGYSCAVHSYSCTNWKLIFIDHIFDFTRQAGNDHLEKTTLWNCWKETLVFQR